MNYIGELLSPIVVGAVTAASAAVLATSAHFLKVNQHFLKKYILVSTCQKFE